jgi:hypothetical protein
MNCLAYVDQLSSDVMTRGCAFLCPIAALEYVVATTVVMNSTALVHRLNSSVCQTVVAYQQATDVMEFVTAPTAAMKTIAHVHQHSTNAVLAVVCLATSAVMALSSVQEATMNSTVVVNVHTISANVAMAGAC